MVIHWKEQEREIIFFVLTLQIKEGIELPLVLSLKRLKRILTQSRHRMDSVNKKELIEVKEVVVV